LAQAQRIHTLSALQTLMVTAAKGRKPPKLTLSASGPLRPLGQRAANVGYEGGGKNVQQPLGF
jgi:hypothetical protein